MQIVLHLKYTRFGFLCKKRLPAGVKNADSIGLKNMASVGLPITDSIEFFCQKQTGLKMKIVLHLKYTHFGFLCKKWLPAGVKNADSVGLKNTAYIGLPKADSIEFFLPEMDRFAQIILHLKYTHFCVLYKKQIPMGVKNADSVGLKNTASVGLPKADSIEVFRQK
jgi:hypothetical protein